MKVYIVQAAYQRGSEAFTIVYASLNRQAAFDKMTALATTQFDGHLELVNGGTCYAFPGDGVGDTVAYSLSDIELDSDEYANGFLRWIASVKRYEEMKKALAE